MVENPKKPGKLMKVKKVIPAYIPEHDALILASVRNRAYRLEWCLFDLFGTRFGWEAIIGIIPGIGDAIGVMLALSIYRKCQKIEGGLPSALATKMLFFIFIDFIIGLVPFIGDLGDAVLKCNSWNANLLSEHLDKKYRPSGSGRDERNLVGTDREKRRKNRESGIYLPQDPPVATVFEDFSDEEEDRRQFMQETGTQAAPGRSAVGQTAPVTTQPTAAPPAKAKGGWFSSGRGKTTGDTQMRQSGT